MVGSRIDTKTIGKLGVAMLAALLLLALAPLSGALAAGPVLTIGAPASGSSTNGQTPTFTGTTEDSADPVILKIYAGTGTGGSPTQTLESPTPVSGIWSAQASTLGEGTYTAIAEQPDTETSETGFSAEVTFTVDTTKPVVSLTAPSTPTNDPTPTITGSGGTSAGDLSAVTVTVYVGGSASGTIAASGAVPISSGTWSYTPSTLADGTYTVQASQGDEAGNTAKSGSSTFRVDTKAPSLAVSTPKSGETLTSSRPTFSGSTSNSAGDGASVTIEIYEGGEVSGSPAQSFSVNRSESFWTSGNSGPRLANGVYTVRATQSDSAGNAGASEAVTFTINSPSPTVTLDELPRFINDTTPTFKGSAATSEAKPSVTLKVYRGTSASGTLAEPPVQVPESGGSWVASIEALPEGTYTAQAEQASQTSNPPGVSAAFIFTVDTTAPTVTLGAPGDSTGVETFTGSAGTASGDRRQVTVELFAGPVAEPGAAFETVTVNANPSGAWSATLADLGSGQYTVLAKQSDEAGNVGESQASTFAVNAPAAAPAPGPPAPPHVSFTWVPANPTVGQSVSFVSSSTDVSAPITGYAWDPLGNGPFAPGGAIRAISFATPGRHVVRLRVVDANGLSGIAAETIDVANRPLSLMQPFPIVRIAGSKTSYGAMIKLLSVQVPPGSTVTVDCKGHGCKTKTESRVATASAKSKRKTGTITLSFARFERPLRTGAVLHIRASKSGQIGKYTSFTIRRKKLPVRVDACIRPTSPKPIACPST
jgi:hypothetical protein